MTKIISTQYMQQTIDQAVCELKLGNAVAIPTETVYGLAADATNGEAVAKIFQLKNRPSFNPLICHVDGMMMAAKYGELNQTAEKLVEAFWPGPLTLVVPLSKSSDAHDLVTADLGTIGLRCPCGISQKIITQLGHPIAAPSANKSGRISPTSALHVANEFEETELLIIDGGPCAVGLESTILRIDGDTLTLLRPGAISAQQIEELTGLKVLSLDTNIQSKTKILAPGMMTSHYAPNANVLLNCKTCEADAAWLGFGCDNVDTALTLNLSKTGNLTEAASNLYAYLKKLDKAAIKTICVAPIPMHDLGIAINDRLKRAAAPRNKIIETAL